MTFDACPLCKSSRFELFSKVKDYEYGATNYWYKYLECKDCQCVYIDKPPKDELDIIYPKNYYSTGKTNSKKFELKNTAQFIKLFFDRRLFSGILKKISCKSISCLDVGGGSGWLLNVIQNLDTRVQYTAVIDLSEESRIIAENNGHVFFCSKIEDLKVDKKFNLVLMLNLIEHVSDPKKVLQNTFNLMDSGGMLLIKTPNTDSLNRKLFKKKYWGGLHAPRHFVLFNKNNFINIARFIGFEIADFSYTQGAPQWAASIMGSYMIKDIARSRKRPIDTSYIFMILGFSFALFDLIMLPLLKTDQMVFVLRKP